MKSGFMVIAPGAHTTVQDFGRYGFQDMGVPVSGALDMESLRLANALVGNVSGEAGLEILYHGPTLEVTTDSVRIALAGFGAKIEVQGGDAIVLEAWQSTVLYRGQKFHIVMEGRVSCCYLAIEGGVDLPLCMGSLSTYTRAGLGGYKGRALLDGDELPLVKASAHHRNEKRFPFPPEFSPDLPIRVTWGAQRKYFTEQCLLQFLSQPFTIQPESDRMGYRLTGEKLEFVHKQDIVSDGIATGAIQVPGNGQPIVLLADHQTTGGYAKIATVISADLPRLGRLTPGQQVHFAIVNIEEAERIRRSREKALHALEESMRVVMEETKVDLHILYQANLISGVTKTFK